MLKKPILLLAVGALLLALAPAARAVTIELTDSGQMNLTGRDVLAAANFYDDNRMGNGHREVGIIQGVEFDDISIVDDTAAPFTLLAGGTLTTTITNTDGREFSNDPADLALSGPDAIEAENFANCAWHLNHGNTTGLDFSFGAGYANTDVEVQLHGGGVWGRVDKWGILTAWVDGVEKGSLYDRRTPDMLTFSATTDASGDLLVDVVQTWGGAGGDRMWNTLAGITVTVAPTGLVWQGTVDNNWNFANWSSDGGTTLVSPAGDEAMIVNSGTVNVTSAPNAADSLSIDGGIVDVDATGDLSITNDVSLDSGSLIVDGALAARAMTVAGGTLTATGELNASTLIVEDSGTANLNGATGTIAQVEVATGGALNTSSAAVTDIDVDGGTVTTTGAAAVSGHLQLDSGQVDLTGGNLAVATATVISGGIDASVGALAVSQTATFGTPGEIGTLTMTAGTSPFELSGADVPTARTITLTGDTVSLTEVASAGTVTATASNQYGAGSTDDRGPDGIVNGDGLDGDGLHNTVAKDNWLTTGGIIDDEWVLFDLGVEKTVESFKVWNYSEGSWSTSRGVNGVTIEYGSDETLGSTVPDITAFDIAPGDSPFAGTDYTPASPFNARFIKFNINSDHGDNVSGYVGLAEVQFNGAPVITPLFDLSTTDIVAAETSTLAMPDATDFIVQLGNVEVADTKTLTIDTPSTQVQAAALTLLGNSSLTLSGGGAGSFGDVTAGDGSTITGAVEINGTIVPGNSPGTLNIAGGLELTDDVVYEWEIGAAATDVINVTGGELAIGDITIALIDDGGNPSVGDKLPVFTYDTGTPDIGTINFDTTGIAGWSWGTLALTDDGSGMLYIDGLSAGSGPTVLTWTGTAGDGLWATVGNWTGGTVAPSAERVIDMASAAVLVGASDSAAKLTLGGTNDVALTVDSAATLTVNGDVSVAAGSQVIANVEGAASGKVSSTAGSMDISSVESLRVDWVENGASSMFGGVYTIAEYAGGTVGSLSGEFSNAGSNIGGAYVEAVDYTGGTVDVTLYQQKVGDVDLDGDVEFSDLSNLLDNWGIGTSWAEGDTDFSGDVVFADLSNLLDNWGTPLQSGAGAQIGVVPEPGTLMMLLVGFAGMLIYRKRR